MLTKMISFTISNQFCVCLWGGGGGSIRVISPPYIGNQYKGRYLIYLRRRVSGKPSSCSRKTINYIKRLYKERDIAGLVNGSTESLSKILTFH